MKKWKIIKIITLTILICFIIFTGYIAINEFLKGNYYSDIWGCTTFYWYERFFMTMAIYLYIGGIPLLINVIIFIMSIIRIKRLSKNIVEK